MFSFSVTIQMCQIATLPVEQCVSTDDFLELTSEMTMLTCYCNTNLCNTDLNALRLRISHQSGLQSDATKTALLFSNWLLLVNFGIYIRKVIV